MKKHSYEISTVTLTIILPVVSALIHTALIAHPFDIQLFFVALAIWTVFWGIGVRLLVAGISQLKRPEFTAKSVLGIKSKESTIVIRELGFANFAIGVAGVLTLWFLHWSPGVALIGGLFLGLDGIQHLLKKNRNRKENVALVSDLFVAIVALIYAGNFILTEILLG